MNASSFAGKPAFESALEVRVADGVETIIAQPGEFTPTPVISHAILTFDRGRTAALADGIVITPSGFEYLEPCRQQPCPM